MKIELNNPLTFAGESYAEIKVGVFNLESDRFADAHVLRPMGKRVLPLWRGDASGGAPRRTEADGHA